ncbi:MAG: antitermination protein NusB [Eggerthellaceae bacterium]|nr:antitermination protein NusB [Eggerthellaceae bacterium]
MVHGDYRSTLSPARRLALEVTTKLRIRNAFASKLIASDIDSSALSLEDKAFAARLVLGVVATQGTLDELIDAKLHNQQDLEPRVRDALRISCFEIMFLEKSSYAAVDQGVELVREVTHKATGLANAVLRKIAEEKPRFPFGDPKSDIAAFARLHAFPTWIAKQLVSELGYKAAKEFMEASNESAPLFIAVNYLKVGEEEVRKVFEQAGAKLFDVCLDEKSHTIHACSSPGGRKILLLGDKNVQFDSESLGLGSASGTGTSAGASRGDERDLQGAKEGEDGRYQVVIPGCFQLREARSLQHPEIIKLMSKGKILISDAASQFVANYVLPRNAPAAFLEVGSGRGTKSILLQSGAKRRFGKQMPLQVLDKHRFKLGLLEERAALFGLRIEAAHELDACALVEHFEPASFDAVFIDAPCSGLGTLRRHPEIRWRIREEDIAELAERAFLMLVQAAEIVKVGGVLSYSTCTVTRAENQEVVKRFLRSELGEGFRMEPVADDPAGKPYFESRLCKASSDAHFAVRLERMS